MFVGCLASPILLSSFSKKARVSVLVFVFIQSIVSRQPAAEANCQASCAGRLDASRILVHGIHWHLVRDRTLSDFSNDVSCQSVLFIESSVPGASRQGVACVAPFGKMATGSARYLRYILFAAFVSSATTRVESILVDNFRALQLFTSSRPHRYPPIHNHSHQEVNSPGMHRAMKSPPLTPTIYQTHSLPRSNRRRPKKMLNRCNPSHPTFLLPCPPNSRRRPLANGSMPHL